MFFGKSYALINSAHVTPFRYFQPFKRKASPIIVILVIAPNGRQTREFFRNWLFH